MIKLSLLKSSSTLVVAIVLFVLLIVFYILGYRLRMSTLKKTPEHTVEDLGAINGTLLGLLALLLAFTFGMSNSRYDIRRQLVIEEANDIGWGSPQPLAVQLRFTKLVPYSERLDHGVLMM